MRVLKHMTEKEKEEKTSYILYIQQDTQHEQFDLNCIKNQSNSYLTHPKHIILSKAHS